MFYNGLEEQITQFIEQLTWTDTFGLTLDDIGFCYDYIIR